MKCPKRNAEEESIRFRLTVSKDRVEPRYKLMEDKDRKLAKKDSSNLNKQKFNKSSQKEFLRDHERLERDSETGNQLQEGKRRVEELEENQRRKYKEHSWFHFKDLGPRLKGFAENLLGSRESNFERDSEFPPEYSSIVKSGILFPVGSEVQGWKPISQIYRSKSFGLFSHDVSADDILQGRLENSCLISSMSAIALKGNLVKRLFSKDEENFHSVRLFDSGEWKQIKVDDYVPYYSNHPLFCRAAGKNTWPLILEKAYAKLYGSYQNIESGDTAEALNVLTGAPVKVFNKKKLYESIRKNKMWEFIVNSLSLGFPMTADSYTIIGTEIKEDVKLIELRNPQAKEESSDGFRNILERIVSTIGLRIEGSKGYFWMEFDEFYKKFERVVACKVQDGFKNTTIQLTQSITSDISVLRMEVNKEEEIHLTVYQKNEKHFNRNNGYKYSNMRVLVAQEERQKLRFVKGKMGFRQRTTIRESFKSGTYLIMIQVDWNQETYNQINVAVYAQGPVVIKQIHHCEFNKTFGLFSNDVSADDILQGGLENSCLISSMSAIAQKGNFVKRLFSKDEENFHSVRLFDSGEWKQIKVGDYVPYYSNHPLSCRAAGKNTWPLILEKAYAKLYGSYQNIESGDTAEALNVLTGAPVKVFNKKKLYESIRKNKMWEFIVNSLSLGFPMTADSCTIIRTQYVKLIELRNPCGKEESSDGFRNISEGSKGYFWMEFDEFYKKFERVVACKVQDGFKNTTIQLTQSITSDISVLRMEVNKEEEIHLTVYQKNEKHFNRNNGYKYSNMRVLVAQEERQKLRFVKGKMGFRQRTTIRESFKPGTYLIMIQVDWNQETYNQINVAAYAQGPVVIKQIHHCEFNEVYKRFIKAFVESSKVDPKPVYDKYNDNEVQKKVKFYSIKKFGLWIQYFINEEGQATFNVTLSFSGLNRWKGIYPLEQSSYISLSIGPQKEEMVIHKIRPEVNYAQEVFTLTKDEVRHSCYFKYSLDEIKSLCMYYSGNRIIGNGIIELPPLSYSEGRAYCFINNSGATLKLKQYLDCRNVIIETSKRTKKIGDTIEDEIGPGNSYVINFVKDKPDIQSCFPSERPSVSASISSWIFVNCKSSHT